jgi:hypothetical protein
VIVEAGFRVAFLGGVAVAFQAYLGGRAARYERRRTVGEVLLVGENGGLFVEFEAG